MTTIGSWSLGRSVGTRPEQGGGIVSGDVTISMRIGVVWGILGHYLREGDDLPIRARAMSWRYWVSEEIARKLEGL